MVQGASGKPPAYMTRDNSAARNFLLIGPDAPTPAREKGLQPYGALTLFFRWRKKSVQKKASGTATLAARPTSHYGQALRYACAWLRASWPSAISGASRPSASLGGGLWSAVAPSGLSSTSVRCAHPPGKRLLLPILMAGLAMSRAMKLDSFHKLLERARARLFPPSKWAGLFPSAAYRRSAPAQSAWGRLTPCGVGCFLVAWVFLQRKRPA